MKTFCWLISTLLILLCSGCSEAPPAPEHVAAAPPALPPDVVELPSGSPKLARIHVAPVGLEQFPVEEVVAPGKVELNPNRISRVLMPVAGRVREVMVHLGDTVAQGQPLLVVDSPDAGAALTAYRQAQAQVRQARSALSKAEKDLARARELYEHRATALKDVLAGENDQTQAQSAVDQANAAADDSLHRLELLGLKPDMPSLVSVRAPLPGKVMDIAVVPGEYRTDTTSPLMTIADLSTVWIAADVPESVIRRVTRGEPLQVELAAYPGEVFRGRVMRIADVVDPQTRTIKVQAEISNPAGKLRPEMFGRIRHSHGMAPMPALPAGALLQRDGTNLVLVEEAPGRFRERPVAVEARKGDLLSVKSGVAAGERVVVDGAMLLRKN